MLLALRRVAVPQRAFSTVLPRVTPKRATEAGPGGRSSNAGVKVAIFGASGFLGRYVCFDLGQNGVLAYLGNRGDDLEMRYIKPMFDLGRSRFVFYSTHDEESMKEVIADADIVINLIGKYYETKRLAQAEKFPYVRMKTNFTYEQTNVDIARKIAELCVEMQVDNLIHVSCAAADPNSSSEWARTKYAGEMAVKEVYPWATIIRPTQLFGVEDRLLNWFANVAGTWPVVPLVDGGNALTQPVWAVDVARTIGRVVDDPETFEGKSIDCFGPNDYSYKELAEFVFDITEQNPTLMDIPKSSLKSIARGLQYTNRNPLITPDLVELWSEDYLPRMAPEDYKLQTGSDKILTMEDLGIEATPLEKEAFSYLYRFRTGGHFTQAEGYH
jgi:NADH dehydrogenase (ubiquinone) 1 alpha subcomplex subunit 9